MGDKLAEDPSSFVLVQLLKLVPIVALFCIDRSLIAVLVSMKNKHSIFESNKPLEDY
jgi:hypothetical protein